MSRQVYAGLDMAELDISGDPNPLGDTARQVLRTIVTRLGAASTRELAAALDLTQSEVTTALAQLEYQGLVEPAAWRVTAEGRARAKTPGQAKRLGRSVCLPEGWEGARVAVMRKLVLDKFTRHAELAECLLATRGRDLVEKSDWGDRFWGMYGGEGKNRLGHLLMEVRAYLAGRRDEREGR